MSMKSSKLLFSQSLFKANTNNKLKQLLSGSSTMRNTIFNYSKSLHRLNSTKMNSFQYPDYEINESQIIQSGS